MVSLCSMPVDTSETIVLLVVEDFLVGRCDVMVFAPNEILMFTVEYLST